MSIAIGADPSIGQYRSTTDRRAMAVANVLFFMVGFCTCLNDLIIPHLKSIFELNYGEAMLVQFAFFSSYFVFSYPGGRLVEMFGYKRSMVVGLAVMAVGAGSFIPATYLASFPVFLSALVVLAGGMTTVQVSANPFVTIIGPASTASSRLNLAQAFNSVGTFIAPYLGGLLILGGAAALPAAQVHAMSQVALHSYRTAQASTVLLPYTCIALLLLGLAAALAMITLEKHGAERSNTQDFRAGEYDLSRPLPSIWHRPWLLAGAIGIFTYVGAEVSIGSLLVNYMGLPQIGALPERTAANFLMVYWGGAMIGRFIGSAVLQRMRTGLLLGICASVAFLLVATSILTHGHLAYFALLAVGACNSIMFPSIFTLGILDLGVLTSRGSSLMIAAIVGGAIIPLLTGRLADLITLQRAFVVPALCYIYIAFFGLANRNRVDASGHVD